jgi:putative SOS response-associated peptidase YedK
MCGRYTLTTPGGRALAERFTVGDEFEPATLGRFNVCPTEPIAVVVAGEDGSRSALTVRWGLIPPWAHELGKGFQPINGKSETAADKAPFAELMARPERHCLVLADGWYEWLKAETGPPARERIPFRYTIDGGEPFAFAGLWCRRRIAGQLVLSACILTCAANEICAPVHDRMPCVLAGPEEEAAWLAGEADGLLAPCAAERVTAAPANPAVNKAGVEGAELLVVPPPAEPAQLSLDT